MTVQVMITASGRMSLPADIRRRLGLINGGTLLVEETPHGVILRTPAQAVAEARAVYRRYAGDRADISVDDFLANRRADSGE